MCDNLRQFSVPSPSSRPLLDFAGCTGRGLLNSRQKLPELRTWLWFGVCLMHWVCAQLGGEILWRSPTTRLTFHAATRLIMEWRTFSKFGRGEKTPTRKTRFSIWTLLRTPGRFTTRPLPVHFATKMSVVRLFSVLSKDEIGL